MHRLLMLQILQKYLDLFINQCMDLFADRQVERDGEPKSGQKERFGDRSGAVRSE